MQPITGTVEHIVEKVIEHYVQLMVKFVQEKTGKDFQVSCTTSFSKHRNVSRGGIRRLKPFLSFALHKYTEQVETDGKADFIEYESFAKSPVVGTLRQINWEKRLAVLVAHEIAHAVQYSLPFDEVKKIAPEARYYKKCHGHYFQAIYAVFRQKFINGIEHDIPVNIVKSPIVKVVKPLSKKKSGVDMQLSKLRGGWFCHRYIDVATGKLLATMASKPKHHSQVLVNGEWQRVVRADGNPPSNHTEAKKIVLGKI